MQTSPILQGATVLVGWVNRRKILGTLVEQMLPVWQFDFGNQLQFLYQFLWFKIEMR